MGLAAVALAALAALAGTSTVAAQYNVISDHSFKGPYRSYQGSDGARTLEHWVAGGSTEVNEHFVRLTNDRQSRKGWLWSTRNWAWLDGWTITLRLRVSGQGKRLFGDGMAFWFTTASDYKPGPAHGFSDTFKGFGIMCVTRAARATARGGGRAPPTPRACEYARALARSHRRRPPPPLVPLPACSFDTYVNTDPGHVHKDILVISNDGTGAKLAPHGGSTDPHPVGCEADFRCVAPRPSPPFPSVAVVSIRLQQGCSCAARRLTPPSCPPPTPTPHRPPPTHPPAASGRAAATSTSRARRTCASRSAPTGSP